MPRAIVNYTVKHDGRDKGKVFVLTEMSSREGEEWAFRSLMALMASGVDLPDGFENMGMAGIAQIGLKAFSGLKWEVAKPLLDEMWDCVQIMPDPSKHHIVRNLIEEDIEEIVTRLKIRAEIWKLHADFFVVAARSIFSESKAVAANKKHSRNT